MTINWWQSVIIGIVIFSIGFGVARFTQRCPTLINPIIKPGTPDTTYLPSENIHESEASSVPSKPLSIDQTVQDTASYNPYYYTNVYEKTTEGNGFRFTSRTYVDSAHLDSGYVIHEYDFQPRPPQIVIQRVDTIYVPKEVEVPEKPSLLEDPRVSYPIGFLAGVATVLLILKWSK